MKKEVSKSHVLYHVLVVFAAVIVLTFLLIWSLCLLDAKLGDAPYKSWNPAEKDFRSMNITPEAYNTIRNISEENNLPLWSFLAVTFVDSEYQLTREAMEGNWMVPHYRKKMKRVPSRAEAIGEALKQVWADVACFPVPIALANKNATVAYENSWAEERTFGGDRFHEGTDLMPSVNEPDYYPVVSMTDGVVENIGWLKLGGYRIGIRSTHGGYFYYAHLSSYSQEFQPGDHVSAGDLLGMMGNTGYSEVEGTTGKFPVHLHVGIYITGDNGEEVSVNPYYILRFLESKKTGYFY